MTERLDVETVTDDLMALFKAELPGKLQELDAASIKPLNPKSPISWIFGTKDNLPLLPAILFAGHQTKVLQDEEDWRRQSFSFMIEVYYSHQNLEDCSRIMRRYGEAIDQVLRENVHYDGHWEQIMNESQQYWDMLKNPKGGLMQAVQVTFDVIVFTN